MATGNCHPYSFPSLAWKRYRTSCDSTGYVLYKDLFLLLVCAVPLLFVLYNNHRRHTPTFLQHSHLFLHHKVHNPVRCKKSRPFCRYLMGLRYLHHVSLPHIMYRCCNPAVLLYMHPQQWKQSCCQSLRSYNRDCSIQAATHLLYNR